MTSQINQAAEYITTTGIFSPDSHHRPRVDTIFCPAPTSIYAHGRKKELTPATTVVEPSTDRNLLISRTLLPNPGIFPYLPLTRKDEYTPSRTVTSTTALFFDLKEMKTDQIFPIEPNQYW